MFKVECSWIDSFGTPYIRRVELFDDIAPAFRLFEALVLQHRIGVEHGEKECTVTMKYIYKKMEEN